MYFAICCNFAATDLIPISLRIYVVKDLIAICYNR